jgi:hypothetical protein
MSITDYMPQEGNRGKYVSPTRLTHHHGTQINQVFLGSKLTNIIGGENRVCLDWWALLTNFPYLRPITSAYSSYFSALGFGVGLFPGGTGGIKDLTVGDRVLLHNFGENFEIHRSDVSLRFQADPDGPKSRLVYAVCAGILASISAISIAIDALYAELKDRSINAAKVIACVVYPAVLSTTIAGLKHLEKYIAGIEKTVAMVRKVRGILESVLNYMSVAYNVCEIVLSSCSDWFLELFSQKQEQDLETCVKLAELAVQPA